MRITSRRTSEQSATSSSFSNAGALTVADVLGFLSRWHRTVLSSWSPPTHPRLRLVAHYGGPFRQSETPRSVARDAPDSLSDWSPHHHAGCGRAGLRADDLPTPQRRRIDATPGSVGADAPRVVAHHRGHGTERETTMAKTERAARPLTAGPHGGAGDAPGDGIVRGGPGRFIVRPGRRDRRTVKTSITGCWPSRAGAGQTSRPQPHNPRRATDRLSAQEQQTPVGGCTRGRSTPPTPMAGA